ncbi:MULTISPECIES: tRNA pseudouridine(55) synthase TruB [Actinotignum]|uniref:tRNA pseudouridine synthase B n=3 Tax=Actinomycetaceae TaxID=2049 RepID=A0AAW9HG31_9ACTO|nr:MULTISPECIES: tRNA pseudouridine(55) synthase TruB [Actinotignum]MDE1557684.1 tRNA pseudouridine(55) synthase TruB [Actinotignum schaalii]MDE1662947.1 tRNA pseudouridine(55) synthase TruB [Actinotignum schaalii]MDK6373445.1 tRNA pseudouridine(55) synthase TruB [Actinotignum timonense]MDK6418320.1 tRNA pseudouridine(55) synthase TruB [Actinotignum timonense]MDK6589579.1 tRNA pseudouridine(55) synthase TruB [Actinotignum timonense]
MKPMRQNPWPDLPRAQHPAPSGVLVIDKPAGVTSHDVVAALRRLCGIRKVGHAGTLDPMATGVLVVGIGAGTRLLTYLSGADKDYRATFTLGIGSDTEDCTGTVTSAPGFSGTTAQLDAALASLQGDISQVPSAYSAKKIAGQRAYDLARAGQDVVLEAVPIHIARLERSGELRWRQSQVSGTAALDGPALTDSPAQFDGAAPVEAQAGAVPVADVDVEVSCSSGTYVRALARDTGIALGSAALMSALRRTRVGGFRQDEAVSVAELAQLVRGGAQPSVIPLAQVAARALPTVQIEAAEAESVRHGQFLEARGRAVAPAVGMAQSRTVGAGTVSGQAPGAESEAGTVALLHGDELVAVARRHGDSFRPATVFPPGA